MADICEVVFTKAQIIKKEFYQKWIEPCADPRVRDIIAAINGRVECMFSIIYDILVPRTILWLVLYNGKYLPIETPYGSDGLIIYELVLENRGFALPQNNAVELSDLASIIWRKFLCLVESIPISYQDPEMAEIMKTDIRKTLSFVTSGHHYPITYTVEMGSDGLFGISENRDGSVSRVDGVKVLVTDLGYKKRLELVDIDYSVRSDKGERDIRAADLTSRQIRAMVREGDCATSYIIPSCSDGKFRPNIHVWRERGGVLEEMQGKVILVKLAEGGKNTLKIVSENTVANILDGEYEITDEMVDVL
jgi:hypothetical protein